MAELKPCPFCGKSIAEVTDAHELEDCAKFQDESCPCDEYESWGSCSLKIVVCSVEPRRVRRGVGLRDHGGESRRAVEQEGDATTAARVFCILSAVLCAGSVYFNKRDGVTADRLLFLAYSMLAIGIVALLRRWGVL